MDGWMAYESREELADAGSDVAGLNAVEGREVEVGGEEGVVGGHRGGGEGGAGGGGGAFPRAEGAEREGVDLGILRAGSGSGRAKKSPVFFLAARAQPDPVAGP